jgi:hypothetical protein
MTAAMLIGSMTLGPDTDLSLDVNDKSAQHASQHYQIPSQIGIRRVRNPTAIVIGARLSAGARLRESAEKESYAHGKLRCHPSSRISAGSRTLWKSP